MTRRPQGAGTVYQHKTKKTWVAQLDLGTAHDGTRRRVSRSAPTKKAAQALLQQLLAAHATTQAVEQPPTNSTDTPEETSAAYLERWFAHKRPGWSDRTIELYRHQLDHHILPVVGSVALVDLKPRHVQEMVDAIVQRGTVSTANKCRRLLYSALKQAVRWEQLDRNPVDAVDPVREDNTPREIWTQQQAATFIQRHRSHRHFAAFYLLLTSGLRRGELLGLRWDDITEAGLHVRQTVKLVNDRPTLGSPKTKASTRHVTLAPDTLLVLQEHHQRQQQARHIAGDAWTHPELVFPSETGTIMDPKNFYRAWKHAVKTAGLPPSRIHDMRHLHVSLLILAGVDSKTVSERAGHSSASFTLDRYAHVFREQRQRAGHTLDELLGMLVDEWADDG